MWMKLYLPRLPTLPAAATKRSGVILPPAGVAVLDIEVAPAVIQPGAVQHHLTVVIDVIQHSLYRVQRRHEPVFVVADEQVDGRPAEEVAIERLVVAHPLAHRLHQLQLAVLLQQHVLVRPRIPVGYGLPPGRGGDEVGEFH